MNNDYFGMDNAFPEFTLTPVQQLAKEMGVTESELQGFVSCLRVWTDKGLSLEEAINKNMAQMTRFVNDAHLIPKQIAVDAFFP